MTSRIEVDMPESMEGDFALFPMADESETAAASQSDEECLDLPMHVSPDTLDNRVPADTLIFSSLSHGGFHNSPTTVPEHFPQDHRISSLSEDSSLSDLPPTDLEELSVQSENNGPSTGEDAEAIKDDKVKTGRQVEDVKKLTKTQKSPNKRKRKPDDQTIVNQSIKLLRMDQVLTTIQSSVSNLPRVPGCLLAPKEICRLFCERLYNNNFEDIQTLTRLFCGFANVDAFQQLRTACSAARSSDRAIEVSSRTVQIVAAIERSEVEVGRHEIFRRISLVELLDVRLGLEQRYQAQKPHRELRAVRGPHTNRASSQALEDMETDLCPGLAKSHPQYQSTHKRLQNHLSNARNWQSLRDVLSLESLVLIPMNGPFTVCASK